MKAEVSPGPHKLDGFPLGVYDEKLRDGRNLQAAADAWGEVEELKEKLHAAQQEQIASQDKVGPLLAPYVQISVFIHPLKQ